MALLDVVDALGCHSAAFGFLELVEGAAAPCVSMARPTAPLELPRSISESHDEF